MYKETKIVMNASELEEIIKKHLGGYKNIHNLYSIKYDIIDGKINSVIIEGYEDI